MSSDDLPGEFRSLYAVGESLGKDIRNHLDTWPSKGSDYLRVHLPSDVTARIEKLRDRAHRWFNDISIQVLPQTTYDRSYTNILLRRITAAIAGERFYEEYHGDWYVRGETNVVSHNVTSRVSPQVAKEEAGEVINETLRLIRTATVTPPSSVARAHTVGHVANTAFILMWMDKNHPELVDVHQAVKEVFAEFRIEALRADEISIRIELRI
jgi:hypothetical protein